MSFLLVAIITLIVIDGVLVASNKVLEYYRKKNSEKFLKKDRLKANLLGKISELNNQLTEFEKNHIAKSEYNDLVHKYNILLNQYRILKNDNESLKNRIKKLKDKIY